MTAPLAWWSSSTDVVGVPIGDLFDPFALGQDFGEQLATDAPSSTSSDLALARKRSLPAPASSSCCARVREFVFSERGAVVIGGAVVLAMAAWGAHLVARRAADRALLQQLRPEVPR